MDLYKTLGVDRSAPTEVVEAAYRALAKKHHPDKNPGDPNAAARFRDIQDAYETLRDPGKRAAWDRKYPPTPPQPEPPRSSAPPPGPSTKPPRSSATAPPEGAASSDKRPPRSQSTKSPPNNSQSNFPPRSSYRWSTQEAPPPKQNKEREFRWPALIGIAVLIIAAIVKNGGLFDSEAVESAPTAIAQRPATSTPKPTPSPTGDSAARSAPIPRPTSTPYPVSPDALSVLLINGNGQSIYPPYREIELVPGTYSVKLTIYSPETTFFSAALRPTTHQYAPVVQLIARNFPPSPARETVTIRSGEPYSIEVRCGPGILWLLELTRID